MTDERRDSEPADTGVPPSGDASFEGGETSYSANGESSPESPSNRDSPDLVNLGTTTTPNPAEQVSDPVEVSEIETSVSLDTDRASDLHTFGTEFRREAQKKELRLDVDRDAKALSHVFQTAEGEFCFGVFGSWGRGKSTLVNELKEELKAPDRTQFTSYVPYDIVDFSAWKYRSTPELWAHLYECFAQEIRQKPFLDECRIALGASIERRGIRPLIFSHLAFAVSIIPLFIYISIGLKLVAMLGIVVSVFTLGYFLRLFKSNGSLAVLMRYMKVPTHVERLGLQASIGQDLKALVTAWHQPNNRVGRGKTIAMYVAIAFGVACFLIAILNLDHDDRIPVVGHVFVWSIFALHCIAWAIFGVFFGYQFTNWSSDREGISPSRKPSGKILLCIDDLDRCEIGTMLDVIESVRIQLDDKEISRRLQVVIIVDPEILDHAVEERFQSILRVNHKENSKDIRKRAWILEEAYEKCFSSFIRLEPLSHSDFSDLASAYLGGGTPMRSVPFLPAIEPSEVIWSDEDQEAIGWATKNLDLDQTPVGPRRLRFVLFQYQLGKLILRQHNLVIDQEILTNLATALVDVFLLGSKKRDWGAGSHLFAVLPKLVRTNSVLNKSNVPDSMASDLL